MVISINPLSEVININASYLGKASLFSSLGLTIGALFSGPINDRFGPKRTFPIYLILISILNAILVIYKMNFLLLNLIYFLRSLCIAGCINNIYVAISLIYFGDRLPKMTSMLYMMLFGGSAIIPILYKSLLSYFPVKSIFIVLSFIMVLFAIGIYFITPHKKPVKLNRDLIKKWKNALKNPVFLALSSVSMICIGGFYGLVSVFGSYMVRKGDFLYVIRNFSFFVRFFISLAYIQLIGRVCTFIASTYSSVRLNNKNVKNFLTYGIFLMFVGSILIFHGLYVDKLGIYGVFGLILFCMGSGIAQPATKTSLLNIAKENAGGIQSVVGSFNSIYEAIAYFLVFYFSYPIGSYAYMMLTSALCFIMFLSFKKFKEIF